MKNAKKIFIVILAVILYCNIGWVVGSYYLHQIFPAKPAELNFVGKIAAGGWDLLAQGDRSQDNKTDRVVIITMFGVIWPLGLVIAAIIWIVYFAYYVGWFIFAGGAVKLLSLV